MSRTIQADYYSQGDIWDRKELRPENRHHRSRGEQSPSLDYRIVPSPRGTPRSWTAPFDDGRRDFPQFKRPEPPVLRQKFNDFGDLYPCTDDDGSEASDSPGFASGHSREHARYREGSRWAKFPLPVDDFEDPQYDSFDEDELRGHARHVTRHEQANKIESREPFRRGHQARLFHEEEEMIIESSSNGSARPHRSEKSPVARMSFRVGMEEVRPRRQEEVVIENFRNSPTRPRRREKSPMTRMTFDDGMERVSTRRQEGHAEREEREQRDRLIRRLGGILGEDEKNDFIRFRASSIDPMLRGGRREGSKDFIGW